MNSHPISPENPPAMAIRTPAASPSDAPIHRRPPWMRRLVAMIAVIAIGGAAFALWQTREQWQPLVFPGIGTASAESDAESPPASAGEAPSEKILLSEAAQKNLRLIAKPLTPQTYWKTITVPGMVIDLPGQSDRIVISPVTGIVTAIRRRAGDVVRPGEELFSVHLLSEAMHQTQTDLFRATQDSGLAIVQKQRLQSSGGAIPEARIIEVDNQISRLAVATKAYRQELQSRGLTPEQITGITQGKFVHEIPIRVTDRHLEIEESPLPDGVKPKLPTIAESQKPTANLLEIQEVAVELGQQVVAGQTLCFLANHQSLAIEGRAFRDELPQIERSFRNGWPVEVDFGESDSQSWPPMPSQLPIRYLANTIDPESRTFRFLMSLENQSQLIQRGDLTQILWRFRPGQRVRLQVRTEAMENVFVLPPDAVVRNGADAFVFRQNGDIFDRKPVHVLAHDRLAVVVANDGSVPPGIFVAQTGAAQLNRMIQSQRSTLPKGFHIHADGSVHMGSHD
ncbi:efflux RND transporter periplasmic adaptor subunit [Tuwongella immobilis]|uniref:RND efflux pump membrane fusion protein barrel-sandwich domain-containing protein n=1 Tax=Tuwongella immobilis TaxID=692036 RepID=A0A6C2YVA5_9BACT|nr:hypothetical protein [Tuwongella immobilis]VIP04845.1 Uncharacterized protein OS=Planctomyces maris DSM 8797 GN=PM8797T_19325 PE=4 SV=1 [Tuwongella immobilis]VTS07050.1 Uncharacterized protein OS=Planctomyces maris DSM 8797 GN=PM8797T_19325 PE=4 SV=1 [Tuwongella immobilis]